MSDGAGISGFGADSSSTTVKRIGQDCLRSGKNLFKEDSMLDTAERWLFNVQKELSDKARALNTGYENMMCTLVLLCIDKKKRRYATLHVGDGLIAQIIQDRIKIISYPENGSSRNYTYMVNSENAFRHLRVKCGSFSDGDMFFLCSDGVYENCFFSNEYKERIKHLMSNTMTFKDDGCFILINTDSEQLTD